LRRRRAPVSDRALGLGLAWTITSVVLAAGYYTWKQLALAAGELAALDEDGGFALGVDRHPQVAAQLDLPPVVSPTRSRRSISVTRAGLSVKLAET
jgi:hypothetical protein